MTPIIEVHHLSKRYRIGRAQSYFSLRDSINHFFTKPLFLRNRPRQFWSLHNLSFQVEPGQVLGIIGSNGAGKSTLLKILSRITPPTKGTVDLHGRVASLLEVGTGFHPELTGRENIFLNGAILGMSQKEIRAKFDEITSFAEIDNFLDTPVKHYSSGMYMRLAFAVAAHLEPEILLVDEVLAVGDHQFQRKCLGKMRDVSRGGRTVIFVSHNLESIKSLCTQALLLDKGRIIASGSPQDVVSRYINNNLQENQVDTGRYPILAQDNSLTLLSFSLLNSRHKPSHTLISGNEIHWSASLKFNRLPQSFNFVIALENENNSRVVTIASQPSLSASVITKTGRFTLAGSCPGINLQPGYYRCAVGIRFNDQTVLYQPSLGFITIRDNSTSMYPGQNGLVRTDSVWHISHEH
ncbi:hypothetical protein A2368_01230 [Candidatus Collierbacteria bacterium RIFOXYB1_FULL_49_13]|uniref:ABC transporter domain-containing protein n=1 Tax=Candidatus Collierbacteria bacterium RIFOXYB1_FULL_49_13 TaxID=1817728 RepID=A0A1F5FFI5_9BACT|nr:MAG: hypothetical protein A2368_01230 [Candidatus Collierbacteria bacterium RIFOXYB1_FULL_49_13]